MNQKEQLLLIELDDEIIDPRYIMKCRKYEEVFLQHSAYGVIINLSDGTTRKIGFKTQSQCDDLFDQIKHQKQIELRET